MKFNTEIVRKNNIELLDCQIELILKSLEFYAYTYRYIYPRHGKPVSKEEDLRISLVTDTYEQIISQLEKSELENPIFEDNFRMYEKIIKEIV